MFKKRIMIATAALFWVVHIPSASASDGEAGGLIAAAASALATAASIMAEAATAAAAWATEAAVAAADAAAQYAAKLQLQATQEQTAAVTGAINAAMKVNAVATTDALNAHKNTVLMGMAASDKLRIANEQSLTTLPLAAQTGTAAMVAGQGISGASQTTSWANIALAKRHLTAKSGSGKTLDAYQNYVKNYAENGAMPNADILADTLLSGAGKSGNVEAMTFSDIQVKAAQDYIANAVEVASPADIPDTAANSVEGRRFRMLLRAEKARMSLAFKSFADALAYRTKIQGFNAGKDLGIPVDGDISYQEFLTNEVRRRYNNKEWYAQVGGSTPANLQREDLFMQALELHFRLEKAKKLEKIELLLAQMNMNQIADPNGPHRKEIEQQRARIGAPAK